jgi:hypothetical protein
MGAEIASLGFPKFLDEQWRIKDLWNGGHSVCSSFWSHDAGAFPAQSLLFFL